MSTRNNAVLYLKSNRLTAIIDDNETGSGQNDDQITAVMRVDKSANEDPDDDEEPPPVYYT
ncbi:hypothetical protein J6590_070171 [Homalodisca vitripennis]|nr:hypothetical protein J6590_070171 [Homalodisca vitripennis]